MKDIHWKKQIRNVCCFLEVKNWVYWKTLRIKAMKVVWGVEVAEKEVFLCLYAVPSLYNHPVWFMKFYLFTLQVLKILRTAGQIEGFCLYILDKISFNLKRFSQRFFFFSSFEHLLPLLLHKLNGGNLLKSYLLKSLMIKKHLLQIVPQ